MPKRISPSISAIKREVKKTIRGYFQELADEFPGNFDPDELSANVAVFYALAAHHPKEEIMAAFPAAKAETDLSKMQNEARSWIDNKGDFAMAVFGAARTLNISKTDMGYQEADFG